VTEVRKRLVPVQWIGMGLMAAAMAEPTSMVYYLALVWSNGLLLYLGTVWLARALFRRGFNRVATGGTLRKRYGGAWIDNALSRLLFFLDKQTRLLIAKDFRTFRRDPAQWLQILIFLGLGVLYFSNMRRFYEKDIGRPFQNGISLLTLTATGFLMCAYTGRFIFPMLSLEGRKFWILGLLPLERARLVWGKFAFSATGCIVFAEFLVLFSDWMLGMSWTILAVHSITVAVLALGLSGLSVGLGACLPNFREADPSKIAVSFGGTLNLVAGLFFLIAVIGAMAAPFHIVVATRDPTISSYPWWPWLGLLFGLLAGALAVVLPLRAGARNLRAMEF
jgi:ABC-2 type transport system permease protein